MVSRKGYCLSHLAYGRTFFFFYTFKDRLFAVNQTLMFTCSLITTLKRFLMSIWLKKRLANITGSKKWDKFGRLLTYTRSWSDSRIDP